MGGDEHKLEIQHLHWYFFNYDFHASCLVKQQNNNIFKKGFYDIGRTEENAQGKKWNHVTPQIQINAAFDNNWFL